MIKIVEKKNNRSRSKSFKTLWIFQSPYDIIKNPSYIHPHNIGVFSDLGALPPQLKMKILSFLDQKTVEASVKAQKYELLPAIK